MLKALSVLLCAAVLALAACGDDEEQSKDEPQASAPAEEQPGPCKDVEQPTPRDDGGQEKPRKPLDRGKVYEVAFRTSCGDFTIRLDQRTSPNATASFAALARSGFFDDTIFHRIVPGYVIQAGDPTVTGGGEPGYSTRDSVPDDAAYVSGVVAMARGGDDPPGTAGSQFFVVTAPKAELPPDYALLGKVTKGMDVVRAIGELGDPASGDTGTPLQSVVIDEAKVRER